MESDREQIDALKQEALALLNGNRLEEARALYSDIAGRRPDDAETWHLLGSINGTLGRIEDAGECCRRAVALRPDYSEAHVNLGNVLLCEGRYEEAASSYLTAIRLDPNLAEIHYNLGNLMMNKRGDYEKAVRHYQKAVRLKPTLAQAHHNLGVAFLVLGDRDPSLENLGPAMTFYADALAGFDRAISLKPDYAEAFSNRGVTLRGMNRHQEALASYDRALSLDSRNAGTYNNRGIILQDLHRYDEALASYDKAIALSADYGDTIYNKSILQLLLGNYQEGWRLHEWRWAMQQQKDTVRGFRQPLWLGDRPVAGRTVLLHAEQGLGDVIQFVRYAPMVAALGARVILEVQRPLIPLLSSLQGHFSLIAKGEPLPEFDLHCPLMSLPLAFGTTVATIPAQVPYLAASDEKRSLWRERLGPGDRSRVGLAWSGSPGNRNDRNRSIGVRRLAPLFGLPVEYHALQNEIRDEDRSVLSQTGGIANHEAELRDFSDTAALMAELGLIITVDTSIAHLAGALGKEVWILLPHAPDYRWLTKRRDSPWYPTARLFRQRRSGDWAGVVAEVHAALRDRFAK